MENTQNQLNKAEIQFCESYMKSGDVVTSYSSVFDIDISDVTNIPLCLDLGNNLLSEPKVKSYIASRKVSQLKTKSIDHIESELWEVVEDMKNNPHKDSSRIAVSALAQLVKLKTIESIQKGLDDKDNDSNVTFEIKL